MKIRIKGNSLRYRLTKSDVAQLAKDGYIAETTDFGTQSLIYALQRSTSDRLKANFQNNKITLLMPEKIADEWICTERVGFESAADNFFILIEKDFKCLDTVAEDQSDNYPNPLSHAG